MGRAAFISTAYTIGEKLTPRPCSGLSVALPALYRASRLWLTCLPSGWSRARAAGSAGTMQHGCGAVLVTEALPR